SRFIAVTSSPIHPAKAVGCRFTLTVSGSTPSTHRATVQKTIELPRSIPPAEVSSGVTCDHSRLIIIAASATTKPAHGPAAPISNIARRLRGSDLIRIKAPKVPIEIGKGRKAGIKYGRLASTP